MLSVLNTQRTLAIDFCGYENSIDPQVLMQNKVSLPIIKCSSGVQEDKMFRTHAERALTVYKKIAVYHWIDPTVPAAAQAKFIVDLLREVGYPIAFVMLDFEQWWSNWFKWYQATSKIIPWEQVPVVPNLALANHASLLANLVEANGYRVNVYTGMWFVNEYTPSSRVWLSHRDTVISAYPRQPVVRTKMEWTDLKQYYPTAIPTGIGNIVGQQFTGDRCMLPGVWAVSGGRLVNPPLDVSMFDISYLQGCGVDCHTLAEPETTLPPTPPAPISTYSTATVNVGAVNVRTGPGTTYPVSGIRYKNSIVTIYEANSGYSRIGVNMWVYSQYLTPR